MNDKLTIARHSFLHKTQMQIVFLKSLCTRYIFAPILDLTVELVPSLIQASEYEIE